MRVLHSACALLVGALAALAPACSTQDVGEPRRGSTPDPADPNAPASPASEGASLSAEAVRGYMRELAPYLVSRELEPAELDVIEQQKAAAIIPMLTEWTKDEAFARSMRRLVSQKLYVSGTANGIDFDLPGNLAEYMVRQNLPVSTMLTADYCVDAKGAKSECDSGAPYKAGVLATRAYLVSRASRFNLRRAGMLMRAFACQEYPIAKEMQPRVPVETLIPMFASDTERDENGKPKASFGNGTACYTCHGQFSAHSQLFVRFDQTGKYQAGATGLQDPDDELGRSTNGLYTSHFKDPATAKDEASQVFGKPVKNLQEAGRVIAESPAFIPCQVRNLLEYALRLGPAVHVAPEVMTEISAEAKADATFATLTIRTLGHPRVVSAVAPVVGGTP